MNENQVGVYGPNSVAKKTRPKGLLRSEDSSHKTRASGDADFEHRDTKEVFYRAGTDLHAIGDLFARESMNQKFDSFLLALA